MTLTSASNLLIMAVIAIVTQVSVNAQSSNELALDAFATWCKEFGSRAKLTASLELLNNDKCTCDFFYTPEGAWPGYSYQASMSTLRHKIEDVSTFMGAWETDVDGRPATISAMFYDGTGWAVSQIDWSDSGIYYHIGHSEMYDPTYTRPEAPAKAAKNVTESAEKLMQTRGIRQNWKKSNNQTVKLPTPPRDDNQYPNQRTTDQTAQSNESNLENNRPGLPPERPSTSPPRQPHDYPVPSDRRNEPSNDRRAELPPNRQSSRSSKQSDYPEKNATINYDLDEGPRFQIGLMGGGTFNAFMYDFGNGIEINPLEHYGYLAGLYLSYDVSDRMSLVIPATWKRKGDLTEAAFIFDQDHAIGSSFYEVGASGFISHDLDYIEVPLALNFGLGSNSFNRLSLAIGAFAALGIQGTEQNEYSLAYYDQAQFDFSEQNFSNRKVDFVQTRSFGDAQTKYLNRLDYGMYGHAVYRKGSLFIGASLSVGFADVNTMDDWTMEFGELAIPKVTSTSASIFVGYFL